MPIEFRKKLALLTDSVSVEDAEPLLSWAQARQGCKVDLAGCTHLHPAPLQVMLAAGAEVVAWPDEPQLASWLRSVLTARPGSA